MYDIVSHGHPAHIRLRLPRLEVLVGLFAAVVALDVGLVYLAQPGEPLSPSLDHVSSVTWASNGTTLSSASGFAARPSTDMVLILEDTNCLLGCGAISFTTAVVSPGAFTVVNTSLPVIVPGATGNLTVTVKMPARAYDGPLTVTLS
jgi:hypothetical protein